MLASRKGKQNLKQKNSEVKQKLEINLLKIKVSLVQLAFSLSLVRPSRQLTHVRDKQL